MAASGISSELSEQELDISGSAVSRSRKGNQGNQGKPDTHARGVRVGGNKPLPLACAEVLVPALGPAPAAAGPRQPTQAHSPAGPQSLRAQRAGRAHLAISQLLRRPLATLSPRVTCPPPPPAPPREPRLGWTPGGGGFLAC